MSKASENEDFKPGKDYELTTVQDLIGAIAGKSPKGDAITVTRNIESRTENFIPSISVRSSVDAKSESMIPNAKDIRHAKGELTSYLDLLSDQTAGKAGDYTVPIVFRVGGETEIMMQEKRDIEKAEAELANTNKALYDQLQILKDRKASDQELNNFRLENKLKPIPIPSSGAHYISAVLRCRNTQDGSKRELVIMDSLGTVATEGGTKGEINPSYQREVAAITEAFREKFSDIKVKTNPPETVLQSDSHSCGPVCLHNLELELTNTIPVHDESLGIVEIDKVLKFEAGAEKLRKEQKATLEFQKESQILAKVDTQSRYTKNFRISESNAGARANIVSHVANNEFLTEEDKKALLTEFSTQSFEHTDKEVFQATIQDIAKKHPGLATELVTLAEASGKSVEAEKELADDSVCFESEHTTNVLSKRPETPSSFNESTIATHDPKAGTPSAKIPSLDPKALTQALEAEIDPITKAIREQIIAEQKDILKEAMGQAALNQKDFDEYLKTNKDAVHAKIDSDNTLQGRLQNLEVAAYANIHNNKAFNFKTITWDGKDNPPDVKTQIVRNASGEEVCTLKETTIKNPITLGDKTIQNYRQIDFPIKLDKENGPMHVSMAVRDENGNKVPQDKAVYFTAHYDQSGKLTEVSSPVPLKFAGTGDDAIGYVEREGKIYTLPVTKKNYQEMMLEVARNKGHSVDISKATPVIAEDQVSVDKRTEKGAVLGREDPAVGSETTDPVVNPETTSVGTKPKTPVSKEPHQYTEAESAKKAERAEKAKQDLDLTGVKKMFEDADKRNERAERKARNMRASFATAPDFDKLPPPKLLKKEQVAEIQNQYAEDYKKTTETQQRVDIIKKVPKIEGLTIDDKRSILRALQTADSEKNSGVSRDMRDITDVTKAFAKAQEDIAPQRPVFPQRGFTR